MSTLFKDMYNRDSLMELALALAISSVEDSFNVDEFMESVMDETWDDLELKGRMRKISTNLGVYLPNDYEEALSILDRVVDKFTGFFGTIFPDFVEVYGQDERNWDLSIAALERYTEYSSSEFAVRPFIINDEERMMAQMNKWSIHDNEHIRRLSSEGCRPALPWGQALTKYKKDPAPILPILETLKADPSLYVRKSVANNINDISKTHPELIAKLAKDWYGKNEKTDWIVKHGCRTLLKRGNRDVLGIFGYHSADSIEVSDFVLDKAKVAMDDSFEFSFNLRASEATKVRLEYGIDYVKANGKTSRKIFQISEISLGENEQKSYKRKHSFADLTTRKHYPGTHALTLIVNGVEQGTLEFDLFSS